MIEHAPMPYFNRLIDLKLATSPLRPVLSVGRMFTFNVLIQDGIQLAEERIRRGQASLTHGLRKVKHRG